MTNQNNAAQPVLTDDEILQVFADAVGNQEDDARFIDVDRDQAIRIARTLLSALRAPVADEREMSLAVALHFADFPRPYHTLEAPADTNGELYRALSVLAREYRAAQASAPVDEPPGCPTYVCQAAQADGVLCANDECDRASGVRPASTPVAGEDDHDAK